LSPFSFVRLLSSLFASASIYKCRFYSHFMNNTQDKLVP
jgi:hypothetical protein